MTDSTIRKINCRSCDKEVYFSGYHSDSKECQKSKCWLRTYKARSEAAVLKGCNAEDFLNPACGKIKMHEEKTFIPDSYSQNTGRWVGGKWVPWGAPINDDYCDM